jgi:hypothetical protein
VGTILEIKTITQRWIRQITIKLKLPTEQYYPIINEERIAIA